MSSESALSVEVMIDAMELVRTIKEAQEEYDLLTNIAWYLHDCRPSPISGCSPICFQSALTELHRLYNMHKKY